MIKDSGIEVENSNIESHDIMKMAKMIKNAGGCLYLVGGAVRNEIMGKTIVDEDYCVVGISQEVFQKLFPKAILRGKDFSVYDIDGKEFALARRERKSGTGHKQFEIETDKNILIEEDLSRRDITINSIAKNVLTGEIIDPYGGQQDIKNKIIRKTTDAFLEDPLRVYRVARFTATLDFEVEEQTIAEMKKLKAELASLSVERVFAELKKALASDKPSAFFNVLRKAELLEVHFKEFFDLIGKNQPEKYHPEGDSYNHTMMVVDNSVKLTNKLEVRYSCLVHDLGKGTTPAKMLPHHYGHEERGEKLVENLGKRLKVPRLWTSCGKIAAKEHMKGGRFHEMTPKKQVEFIEKIAKSQLGLSGMKVVVCCDKCRDGRFPEDIDFDIIGEKCMKEINGNDIKEKYHIEEGKKVSEKLHEQRILWLKKYYQSIDKN